MSEIFVGELEVVMTVLASVVAAAATAIGTFVVHERRLKREFKTEFMAEDAVRKLLTHEKWKQRSFEEIEKKLGGFRDDDLRKLLVRAGAIRFYGSENKEFWGLINRNQDKLE